MTVDDYEALMRRRLIDAGFELVHPDPALAWDVFRQIAAEPVECHASYLFFEAADGTGDLPGYFDFVREFRHYTEEDAVWHEQVTVHFTNALPDRLEIQAVVVYSSNFPDYGSFFRAVEQRPEFRKGLAFNRWTVELRVDGC